MSTPLKSWVATDNIPSLTLIALRVTKLTGRAANIYRVKNKLSIFVHGDINAV
jgi:hypothetical protein